MMQVKNSGREVSHNVQIAVDSKNHLVVAVDVTSEAVDKEQLHNIALKAKSELGVNELQVVADKGYYSAKQFKQCADDQIIPTVPKAIHSNAPDEAYNKDKFIYDEQQDGYICPEGQLLKRLKRRLHTDIFQSGLFSDMPMWLINVRRKTKRWFDFVNVSPNTHLVL